VNTTTTVKFNNNEDPRLEFATLLCFSELELDYASLLTQMTEMERLQIEIHLCPTFADQ